MIKKFLSVLLAVMMVVSVMTVGVVASNAATTAGFTPAATKFYFDVDGTGWTMGAKDKVAFHIFGGDLETTQAWGAKKEQGTAVSGETGVFEFDPGSKLSYTFTPGVQYKIIFTHVVGQNWTEQTYDLFFTADCLGHVAYSTGEFYENPVDSSKKALAAYWRDLDATEYGPVKAISSIGNVVGECPENGKTDYDIMKEFFTEDKTDFQGKTGYQNAHIYVCEISEASPNYKSEQKLIDDIGAALGLTKDEVKEIIESEEVQAKFAATGLDCSWKYEDSTLEGGSAHEHTPGEPVQENVVPASCKEEGSYDEVVYCTECGEELSRESKTIDKIAHTPGEAVEENVVPASCKEEGSYDEVVYCTVCEEEISRETKTIDKLEHIRGEAVIENDVPATCEDKGSYDEVIYCTVCGEEISRVTKEHDEFGAHNIVFVEKVDATATKDGMEEHYECTVCGKCFSDATGTEEVDPATLVIKADHVRGDANGDGVFDQIDVTVLQRYLVELDVENFDADAADADGDGEIDVIDVTLMQRVLANMTTWEKWDAKHPKA